jgi:hypothetical protein
MRLIKASHALSNRDILSYFVFNLSTQKTCFFTWLRFLLEQPTLQILGTVQGAMGTAL